MEKHPQHRLVGMEMLFGTFPDEIAVGATDRNDENGFGFRPTINLLYPERRTPTVLKLVSCMEQKHRFPRVHLISPASPEDQANVAVFFPVPLSRQLTIELFKLTKGYIPPDDYFKVIVSGEAEVDPENASEFLELYDRMGYFFVDITGRSGINEELLWTKRLTLFSKNRPQL